jgi:hypothetical protein
MNVKWARLSRWLLVLAAIVMSTLIAAIVLEFSLLLPRWVFSFAAVLHFNRAPSLLLAPVDHLAFFCGILLWVLSPAIAVAFALRAPSRTGLHWGLLLSLAMFGWFLWYRPPADHPAPTRWAIVIAGCILLIEAVGWIRKSFRGAVATFAQLGALFVLLIPSAVALLSAPRLPPEPHKLWSVMLQKGTWQAMNTGSDFAAMRQVVIAGDRVIAVFDAGGAGYQGKEPMSSYRVLSLDLGTGKVENQMAFTGRWGNMPLLFLTSDSHIIFDNNSDLSVLNPNLTATGVTFSPDRGRVVEISADGTTLAWETNPGITLLDARTLKSAGTLPASAPTSISREAALNDNISMPRRFPNQQLIVMTDARGSGVIYHGSCASRPEFLAADRVLLDGCGRIRILDGSGSTVAERPDEEGAYGFAGVSQNGSRFALEARDERGDPSELIYERFYIYDSKTAVALATIPVTDLPERQSWTAFSADGHLFAVGNPNRLTLYDVP